MDAQSPVDVLLERANLASKARNWPLAIANWEALLAAENPPIDRVVALAFLGQAYRAVGNFQRSRKALTEGFALQPRNSKILRHLAELEYVVENFGAAAGYWAKLIAKKKSASGALSYQRLAKSLRRTGDISAALAAAEKGARIHRDYGPILFERAVLRRMVEENGKPVRKTQSSPDRIHPYKGLPSASFWAKTVSNKNALEIDDWYKKKFSITGRSIATAGSCFAQHIGKRLRSSGFDFVDVEPAPAFLDRGSHADFGYGMYSARFGNVYSTRQLLQLLKRATGILQPDDRSWAHKGGYVDPFRPTIEPHPFRSVDELLALQGAHLKSVERMFATTDVFVFTLGLTEVWEAVSDGCVFPVAPGVSGGVYDVSKYRFRNLSYDEVIGDLREFVSICRTINPNIHFILTVSPVPLMATASGQNVVVASSASKSVLRAAAGQIAAEDARIDYFPSFEIISSHIMRGQFFNPDGRTVSSFGVDHVMAQFFSEHTPVAAQGASTVAELDPDRIVCDEELLKAFG